MWKFVILLISLFVFSKVDAQRDSLKKFRLSAFQADIGPHTYPEFAEMTQEDYQKIVKTDPFVNVDLSSYKKEEWFMYRTFSSLVGFKLFVEINDSRKIRKEVYLGLKYGQETSSGVQYTRESYDTIAVYTSTNSPQKVYNIAKNFRSYSYGISSQKLIMPLGFNFSSDKSRLFWITYGVEFAPTLNFNYRLNTSYSENPSDVFVREGDSLKSGNNYVINNSPHYAHQGYSNRTKLSGMGFGFNISLPFCVYFHPSKKIVVLKHINLMASIMPTYIFAQSSYSGSASMFSMALATGLRYNF